MKNIADDDDQVDWRELWLHNFNGLLFVWNFRKSVALYKVLDVDPATWLNDD
jgi:hypothetical protein